MALRTKAVVLSIIFVFVFALLQVIDLSEVWALKQEITKALIMTIVFFIGLYWVLGFKVRGIRFITILGYPSFIIFIQTLFIELIIFQNVARITAKTASMGVLVIFAVSTYLLILTINILNVSHVKRIPLVQAAKAANFLYALFSAYFAFLLILRSVIDDIPRIMLLVFVSFFITLSVFWFKRESLRQWLGETLVVVFCLATVFLIFMLWPLSVEVSGMFYIVVFYILLGLGLEERETTSLLMRIEYFLLIIFAIIFVLKFAVWGINGSIF